MKAAPRYVNNLPIFISLMQFAGAAQAYCDKGKEKKRDGSDLTVHLVAILPYGLDVCVTLNMV